MTSMPTPNLPLLRKVLDHIDAHPEEWNQGSWAMDYEQRAKYLREVWGEEVSITVEGRVVSAPTCGTAFCIAGHVAVMTGHEIDWKDDGTDSYCHDGTAWRTKDGQPISAVAQTELGLTASEATLLFSAENKRVEVQEVAEQIAERVGEAL